TMPFFLSASAWSSSVPPHDLPRCFRMVFAVRCRGNAALSYPWFRMVDMSVLRSLGRSAAITVRAAHGVTAGGARAGRFVGRSMRRARERGAAGETGMVRLLDLHAASCAGDTLVALGLAGTIFFSVPAGEARGRVALYLFVTMLPFVLLAPVVGP